MYPTTRREKRSGFYLIFHRKKCVKTHLAQLNLTNTRKNSSLKKKKGTRNKFFFRASLRGTPAPKNVPGYVITNNPQLKSLACGKYQLLTRYSAFRITSQSLVPPFKNDFSFSSKQLCLVRWINIFFALRHQRSSDSLKQE